MVLCVVSDTDSLIMNIIYHLQLHGHKVHYAPFMYTVKQHQGKPMHGIL